MKTIKNSKDITTLEVGDKVIFGDLEYSVALTYGYYLGLKNGFNDKIFELLNISKKDFIKNLGIHVLPTGGIFPEVKSLEALTAIVSALFKEYEKQNELPKTWEEFCERNEMGDKKFCLYHGDIVGIRVSKNIRKDTTLMESPEEAQAFRALMQLRQLRKCYVGDWEPDWENDYKYKYGINFSNNKLMILEWCETSTTLSFPSHKLAEQFLNNFKDLLEIAKPLL